MFKAKTVWTYPERDSIEAAELEAGIAAWGAREGVPIDDISLEPPPTIERWGGALTLRGARVPKDDEGRPYLCAHPGRDDLHVCKVEDSWPVMSLPTDGA